MSLPVCLIHANCQGDALRQLLSLTPEFVRTFEIKKYTNYLRENIPDEDFARCRVFLYQHLSDRWDDLASAALLQRVPPQARILKIPNMFFKGYWPLWTNKTFMAYGDQLLEHLVELNLSPEEILRVFLRGDLTRKYDLAALVDASLEHERRKEQGAAVGTVDLVRELWRKEQLFLTVNHPGSRLLLHVADGVLRALGMGPLPDGARRAFVNECADFEQPIHPQVGAFFHLPFATAQRRYRIYATTMRFQEYASCYVACRLQHFEDFAAFLTALSENRKKTPLL